MTSTVLPGVDVREDRSDPSEDTPDWSSPSTLPGSEGMRVAIVGVRRDGACVTVMRFAGHLDLASRAAVSQCLYAVFSSERQNVVVDLSAVAFCGVGELEMLARPAPARVRQAVGYAVGARSAAVERVAVRVWCSSVPRRYPTTERAVDAALRGDLAAREEGLQEIRYTGTPVGD